MFSNYSQRIRGLRNKMNEFYNARNDGHYDNIYITESFMAKTGKSGKNDGSGVLIPIRHFFQRSIQGGKNFIVHYGDLGNRQR